MNRVKLVLVYLLIACFSSKIYSQVVQSRYYYYFDKPVHYEIGAGIGLMNCITDIGGAHGDKYFYLNEIRLKNFRPGGSIFGSIMYHNYIGARLEATWGQVQSADRDIKGTTYNAASRRIRNLSFRTSIIEIALLGEIHPLLPFDYEGRKWIVDPYLVAGFGWFSFNPQAEYRGRWVDLKPLHTEGQGFPEYPAVRNYKLSQVNIPLGIGVRYELSPRFNLRLEYLHRVLYTDYLDDVSSRKFINPSAFDKNLSPALAATAKALYDRSEDPTISVRRGNPDNNDTYMSLSLKVGVILGRVFKP